MSPLHGASSSASSEFTAGGDSSSSKSSSPKAAAIRRELPTELIDFVSQTSQQPRKRRKLDNKSDGAARDDSQRKAGSDHIVIHRSFIEIECAGTHVGTLETAPEKEIVPYVHWNWTSRRDGEVEYIEILDDEKRRLFHVPLPSDESTKDLHLALQCLYESNTRRKWPSLYTSVSVSLIPEGDYAVVRISFTLKWTLSSPIDIVQATNKTLLLSKVLNRYFPDPNAVKATWSPQDFYTSVHSPEKNDEIAASLRVTGLEADLYPFQRRAVQWLLRREGVEWSQSGGGGIVHTSSKFSLPDSFIQARDADGRMCFVSHLLGLVTLDHAPFLKSDGNIGVLSEEMGLGKTVEMISLISLHRRQLGQQTCVWDAFLGENVRPTGATLIITPPSILRQWISEIHKHAPDLTVFHYKGINAHKNTKFEDLVETLATQDIVVSTYSVLAAEIHFTPLNPEKSLRRASKYPRKKSPLMMFSWWRCLMDEAQMIESGVSKAAVVARMIPRVSAWAVTGTPVRKDVNDLLGLLVFLRLEPYASTKHIWSSLISNHKAAFQKLFGSLALRHSKREVRDELRLPAQRRYVITMPFTPVEEQNYSSLFQQMCEECGLNGEGVPVSDDWDPEAVSDTMRTWLVRLRQTALHPEVGNRNRRALGNTDGPLRTVDQVLDTMIEQTDQNIRADQRACLLLKMKKGQLFENSPRVKESLEIWSDAEKEASSIVEECRAQLRAETDKLSANSAGSRRILENDSNSGQEQEETELSSGLGVFRNRLRNALELLHMAKFFCANAHFQLKEMSESESLEFKLFEKLETDGYEDAKKIRREILEEVSSKAERLMRQLATKASNQSFAEIPEFTLNVPQGGLESRRIMAQLEATAEALDTQAEVIDEWREKTIQLLLRPLVDEDDGMELTGEEYEESTKTQDKLMVYNQALRSTVADRHNALNGQDKNALVEFEAKTSLRLARAGDGPFPEKMIELLETRAKVNPRLHGSFRSSLSELRTLAISLRPDAENPDSRATQEVWIVEKLLSLAQKHFVEQTKVVTALEKEIELFTTTMNTRLDFFRQLQALSDFVAPYEGPNDEESLEKMDQEERKLNNKIATTKSKRRYLEHLKAESKQATEQKLCVICRELFEVGALTVCGHLFCLECINIWWKMHRNCPICKRKLVQADLYDITYKPQELSIATEEIHDSFQERSAPSDSSRGFFQQISTSKLAEIKNVELNGPSFTTKIDTLARHLIWLRQTDPGAKSIVFSQFSDFLNTLSNAFLRLRIGFTSTDKPGGIERFKEDPSTEVLLLHARAQSSGLNLTNASHVFLCEPLLNTALELQAIARVDRIGQLQETNVWLYLIAGTVEESIYQLSVRKRMEHMDRRLSKVKGKGKASDILKVENGSLEEANSMELQEASLAGLLAKGVKSGELVEKEDLWECLFGGTKSKSEQALDRSDLRHDPAVARHLRAEAVTTRAS